MNEKNNIMELVSYISKSYPKYMGGLQQFKKFGLDILSDHKLSANKVVQNSNKDHEVAGTLTYLLANDQIIKFSQLMDVASVDRLNKMERFQICYNFLSNTYETPVRTILRSNLSDKEILVSLTGIFPAANWLERECWDLMGILFADHPDLRRILTNYGFVGHPLRKDFPAVGFVQVRYDDLTKSVIEEPVSLTQEYRYFDFLSPWEQTDR